MSPSGGSVRGQIVMHRVNRSGATLIVETTLDYTAADPYAVTAAFLDPTGAVLWRLSRDLLVEGMVRPSGEGDVRMSPSRTSDGRSMIVIELHSPEGAVALWAPAEALHAFLQAACTEVPQGHEADHLDIDLVIAALMGLGCVP